ncbi:MAG: hypothetical protein ACRC07_25895, partial [Pseudomonas paracarnis]
CSDSAGVKTASLTGSGFFMPALLPLQLAFDHRPQPTFPYFHRPRTAAHHGRHLHKPNNNRFTP